MLATYVGYYGGRSAGIVGESNRDDRLATKELVLGLGFDGDPLAFPHSQLRAQQLVNLVQPGGAAVICFDTATDTAPAFSSVVGEPELSFQLADKDGKEWLQDNQMGTL